MANPTITIDKGCPDGGPSCLKCPLAVCVHDEGADHYRTYDSTALRYTRIWNLWKKGMPQHALARQFGVSRRSVARAIQAGGVAPCTKPRAAKALPPDPYGKPTDQIDHGFKPAKPPRLGSGFALLYFKSCYQCSGDVEVHQGRSARCLQCGWNK